MCACSAGDLGSIPGLEDPLEKEKATHSSTLAWKILLREEPERLQSMGLQRVRHFTFFLSRYTFTGIICPWLADCPKWEADTDWFAYVCSLSFQWWIKQQILMTTFLCVWWILSYIGMKQPWVYMCSLSRSPLPPPSPPTPSRFSQCNRSERLSHASNLGWWSVSP